MKNKLSFLLVYSMLISMIVIPSSATQISNTDTKTMIDITGETYSDLINSGLVDPDFIKSSDGISELTPPPELVIEEGEVWVPGSIDPNLISLYGEDDECRHHGQPQNYRYIGAVYGKTTYDDLTVNLVTGALSVVVPSLGIPLLIVTNADTILDLLGIVEDNRLKGSYMKWQYIYNVGPDPNMYWFHTFYYTNTQAGQQIALGCTATYSPPKPGDRFQD